MPATLTAAVLWIAIAAALVAQLRILRSTARVWRASPPAHPWREWSFAVGPALVVVLVLFLAWRAAMRPPTVEVTLPAAPGEVRS